MVDDKQLMGFVGAPSQEHAFAHDIVKPPSRTFAADDGTKLRKTASRMLQAVVYRQHAGIRPISGQNAEEQALPDAANSAAAVEQVQTHCGRPALYGGKRGMGELRLKAADLSFIGTVIGAE